MERAIIALPPPATISERIRRFLFSPFRVKCLIVLRRVKDWLGRFPSPIQLPYGIWWLGGRGPLDNALSTEGFEKAETNFVQRLLRPGLTVLDIGAHHGLYTMIASKLVGRTGRVIAFEPSPRERKRLKRHIDVNSCSNVRVASIALGKTTKRENLYLASDGENWCNSLRPPSVETRSRLVEVQVRPLDDFLAESAISNVDFIKIDVEGAELDALAGAKRLLSSNLRPIFLIEVEDRRTNPWGYQAREIVRFLAVIGYHWFSLTEDGFPHPIASDQEKYDANLVAVPDERVSEFLKEIAIAPSSVH
ncbi:MAG TPA: FkbM family methyltransferase [Candidatus Acidoferrales bacterium]|jgi:FkbM family methyltransferase|nr:FkbM family methyltransferase [Candidatus Acidoferrales bacterium]